MTYQLHEHKFNLADGSPVYWNRFSGYAIEEDYQYLRQPTKREALEIAQIVSDDDAAFAEECAKEKAASLQQTDLW